jgi:peptidoglycan hydrolase FlgJ
MTMDISLNAVTGYGLSTGSVKNSKGLRLSSQDGKLDSACTDIESMFIQNMFKAMRASIPKNGLMSGGKSEEMFTEMLDAEISKTISASGGIGLSSMIRNQLDSMEKK